MGSQHSDNPTKSWPCVNTLFLNNNPHLVPIGLMLNCMAFHKQVLSEIVIFSSQKNNVAYLLWIRFPHVGNWCRGIGNQNILAAVVVPSLNKALAIPDVTVAIAILFPRLHTSIVNWSRMFSHIQQEHLWCKCYFFIVSDQFKIIVDSIFWIPFSKLFIKLPCIWISFYLSFIRSYILNFVICCR